MWLVACCALLLGVAGLNVAVDPFFVFGTPLIAGFNQMKPATQGRESLAKPHLLLRAQPHTLLIGTSKMQVGISPESPAWSTADQPVFNAGNPGSFGPGELQTLRTALAVAPIRRVLVLIDALDFLEPPGQVDHTPPLAFRTGWPHVHEVLDAALTLDALEASLRTVIEQWTALPSGLRPNGQMYDGFFRGPTAAEGPGTVFGQKMGTNAERVAQIARALRAHPGAGIAQLDTVRDLIEICRERGIALDLAFAPVHADLLRLIELDGLWARYLAARAAVTATVAEAGGGQVPLWDFVGFDRYTTEPVPPAGQHAPALRWFWEPNHFRPAYGELILAAMYRGQSGVGERLTPGNVAASNVAQSAARDEDRQAQPAEWARAEQALRGKP